MEYEYASNYEASTKITNANNFFLFISIYFELAKLIKKILLVIFIVSLPRFNNNENEEK